MGDPVFDIRTSCGNVFRVTLSEMSNGQITRLIEGNAGNPGTAVLQAELARREAERRRAA